MNKLPFREAKLTPDQERQLATARVAFMIACPFYAHLYHSIGKEVITRDISTLATDGRHIAINPDYFCKLSTSEQVFTLAHEMAHLVGRHPQRMMHYLKAGELKGLPVDPGFVNVCADYVINADLVATKVGSYKPGWLLHPQVKGDELWEDVYARLWEDPPMQPPPPPGGGQPCEDGVPGPSNDPPPKSGHTTSRVRDTNSGRNVFARPDELAEANAGAFDGLLPPPVNSVTGEADLPDPNEFKEAVARAFAVAKATTQGTLPASIQRLVAEILAPQIDWRDHIRLLVTGHIGARGETWKRPNRRRLALNPIVYMPGRNGTGCETVVVAIDSSGSITDQELAAYLTEVGGILTDVRPRRIWVIGCDATVSQVDEVTDLSEYQGLVAKGIKGGGGTRFEPVFEYIEQHDLQPEALIYCTDGYGRFPAEPPAYPTIWAMTTDVDPPFGELVRLKLE